MTFELSKFNVSRDAFRCSESLASILAELAFGSLGAQASTLTPNTSLAIFTEPGRQMALEFIAEHLSLAQFTLPKAWTAPRLGMTSAWPAH